MKRIILAMIVLCALVAASTALAQQTTGNITGRIVDAQGAAVPGVTVTARNPQTGFVRTDVSDGEGIYRLTSLPVGSYDVTARAVGLLDLQPQGCHGQRRADDRPQHRAEARRASRNRSTSPPKCRW